MAATPENYPSDPVEVPPPHNSPPAGEPVTEVFPEKETEVVPASNPDPPEPISPDPLRPDAPEVPPPSS